MKVDKKIHMKPFYTEIAKILFIGVCGPLIGYLIGQFIIKFI